jgi:hypothetical protein
MVRRCDDLQVVVWQALTTDPKSTVSASTEREPRLCGGDGWALDDRMIVRLVGVAAPDELAPFAYFSKTDRFLIDFRI